jgi:phosphatidate cytidylyltransferase
MLAVAELAWLAGPVVFTALVAAVCGAMIWELLRLQGAQAPLPLAAGVVAAGVSWIEGLVWSVFSLISLLPALALVLACLPFLRKDRRITMAYGFAILASGSAVIALTGQPEDRRLLLLLLVVVITTDIAGYFAGRFFGGPKFWPRISPKKTWSGTVAGWVVSGVLVGAFTVSALWALGAVVMSFAAQMGDIAESAIKRRAGVKDSSGLIPGHGGVLDRFDGLVGAALVLIVIYLM